MDATDRATTDKDSIGTNAMRKLRAGGLWPIALAYLPAHLFLDWVSFIHELPPLNVTPWNPPAGLMMAALIWFGPRLVPVAWLALVASDALVRGMPVQVWATLLSDAGIAGLYGTAAWVMRARFQLSPRLDRLRDIVVLMGGTLAGAAVVAAGYILIFTLLGLYSWTSVIAVMARYWIGDVIGIMVLTPFLLLCPRRPRPRPARRHAAEMAAQGMAIALALWVDFGPLASDQYEYFYLLFLPVVWVATRHGLAGAATAVLVTQIGLVAAIQIVGIETARMAHFQLLMLALTITALLLGAVVSERRRAEAWVRDRQSELAHASRLAEAGEMTAALAHEINQPLAATTSYARAARKIAQRDGAAPQLLDILDKTVAQAERADRVIRSLRDFVRKGDNVVEPVDVARLVAEAIALAGPIARQHGADVATQLAPGLPRVAGNPIQLQQVLLNLVRNSAEAMAGAVDGPRVVTISAQADPAGFVTVAVRDTGPGLAALVERNLFAPFVTTKPTGMGLGLSIARSIIDAHGGTLAGTRLAEGGTVFRFTLPIAERHAPLPAP